MKYDTNLKKWRIDIDQAVKTHKKSIIGDSESATGNSETPTIKPVGNP
jgi:hypothetical protein